MSPICSHTCERARSRENRVDAAGRLTRGRSHDQVVEAFIASRSDFFVHAVSPDTFSMLSRGASSLLTH